MKTPILTSRRMLLHDPGADCPESPERLLSIFAEPALMARVVEVRRSADADELASVHSAGYVNEILASRGEARSIDAETHLSRDSVDAALYAAGACLELVDGIVDGRFASAVAIVRPPGHHAGRNSGGGYCVFNNVAIAAEHAVRRGVRPVLIVDWDVHHGNGTQEIFWESRDVVLVDIHQDDCFPVGTGSPDERGAGVGFGTTVNVPIPPGFGDADYEHLVRHIVVPVAEELRPQLILVSCGFDAHHGDGQGDQHVTPRGFGRMTSILREVAARHAGGRMGLVLEGGYRLSALAPCVRSCIAALEDEHAFVVGDPRDDAMRIATTTLRDARAALAHASCPDGDHEVRP